MFKKKPDAAARRTKPPSSSAPKFPYTTTPGGLRKFLKQVPQKPRPRKINDQLLKSWGIADTNARTIIRVLKGLGLVAASNQPTADYDAFMHTQTGPAALGNKIKEVYADLFKASKAPHKQGDLENLFNIHSGGSVATIQFQIQTFKALCEFATFDGVALGDGASKDTADGSKQRTGSDKGNEGQPTVQIDLHIHLPPDRSTRDYQAMFEDIGRYLMGRAPGGEDDQRR